MSWKSKWKIRIAGEGIVDLELYAGVITQFEKSSGDLICRNVVVLAQGEHDASAFVAIRFPDWELQCLTCLTDFAWFDFVTLSPDCPQIETLRQFVITGLTECPVDVDY